MQSFFIYLTDFLDTWLHLNVNLITQSYIIVESPERSPATTNSITANVWLEMDIWKVNYKVDLTFFKFKTSRYFDCMSNCLTFSLFCLTRMRAHTPSHPQTCTYRQTAVVSSASVEVSCCRLAVTTPVLGLLFRRKACIGQILFRQIKKSMSSCLHQSTHCLSDGSTR